MGRRYHIPPTSSGAFQCTVARVLQEARKQAKGTTNRHRCITGLTLPRPLQGDVKKLTDDISAVRPTLFVAVPRVLERIQSGIQAKLKAKPWLVRTLVSLAYRWKLSKLKAGVPLNRVSPKFSSPPKKNSMNSISVLSLVIAEQDSCSLPCFQMNGLCTPMQPATGGTCGRP